MNQALWKEEEGARIVAKQLYDGIRISMFKWLSYLDTFLIRLISNLIEVSLNFFLKNLNQNYCFWFLFPEMFCAFVNGCWHSAAAAASTAVTIDWLIGYIIFYNASRNEWFQQFHRQIDLYFYAQSIGKKLNVHIDIFMLQMQ